MSTSSIITPMQFLEGDEVLYWPASNDERLGGIRPGATGIITWAETYMFYPVQRVRVWWYGMPGLTGWKCAKETMGVPHGVQLIRRPK